MPLKCEAEASDKSILFKDEVIDEWPHSWPKGEISYRLNSFSTDNVSERHQLRAVTVALRIWQLRISDLKFRRERNPSVTVDFDISFQPEHMFRSKHVFAHAWYPGQGKISGDVEINDESWNWVSHSELQKLSSPPLVPILCHEFGHSLGLKHDTRTMNSIMYPSFDLGKKKNSLHQYDIERIQQRYGVRTVPQRIIDYFKLRRDHGWDFR